MEEEQNLLSENLGRIKDAMNGIRETLDMPDATIEELEAAVVAPPSGVLTITENGTYDISAYSGVIVQISEPTVECYFIFKDQDTEETISSDIIDNTYYHLECYNGNYEWITTINDINPAVVSVPEETMWLRLGWYNMSGYKDSTEDVEFDIAEGPSFEVPVLPRESREWEPAPEPVPLPPGNYTELKCLISHGTERINTSVIPNDNSYGFKAKFSLGSRTTGDWNLMNIGGYSVDDTRFGFGGYRDNDLQPAGIKMDGYAWCEGVDYDTIHVVDFNYKHSLVCALDDVDITSDANPTLEDYDNAFEYTIPWNIFCQTFLTGNNNQNIGYDRFFAGKLYYLEIFLGDTLVRSYVPVLDSNGVPCLYDMVNETFNYNSGTGAFEYEMLEGGSE